MIGHESFYSEEIMNSFSEVVENMIDLGIAKVNKTLQDRIILGFMGGAMVALAYLGYIVVLGTIGGPYAHLIGSMIFPIGLIIILMVGGELITGNMTVVAMAYWNNKVSGKQLLNNWVTVTLGNLIGGVFVALVLGVYIGGLSDHVEIVNSLAHGKASLDFGRTFASGIACNWIVGLAVWLFMAMKGGFDKLVGAWFPTMLFVLLAFQHSVANIFLFTASMYYGGVTLGESLLNFAASYSGNAVGGAIMVALLYSTVYNNGLKKQK